MPAHQSLNPNPLLLLADETESVLEDLFLSGFLSIRPSALERLEALIKRYTAYGMVEGAKLLQELLLQMNLRKESHRPDLSGAMTAFARMEFYLEHFIAIHTLNA